MIPFKRLAQRPLTVLFGAAVAGYVYQLLGLGTEVPGFVSLMADIGLASLLFTACLFVKWSRIAKISPDALRLTAVSIPLFVALVSLSGFILIRSLSIWGVVIIAIALTLGGSPPERKAILSSEAPEAIKKIIRLEEPAALIFGLILALTAEIMLSIPVTDALSSDYIVLLSAALSFAAGGVIAIIGVHVSKLRQDKSADLHKTSAANLRAAIICALIAFVGVWLAQGSAIIAIGAVGLIWSEEGKITLKHRRGALRETELLVMPVAYGLFGFMLGPRILSTDLLTLIFAFSTITFLRFLPRYLALGTSSVSAGGVIFIAWVRCAPGAVCALYLLHLLGSAILIDIEQVFSIVGACLFWGLVISRISTEFSITQFLQYHDRYIRAQGRYSPFTR